MAATSFEDVKVPVSGQLVFKDECMLTFDTPLSDDGLYVCMNTFLGFGRRAVVKYHQVTGKKCFLNVKATRTKKEKPDTEPPQKKPTKMAIGVDGGFDADADEFETSFSYNICLLPDFELVSLQDTSLPDVVQASAAGIIAFQGAALAQESQAWEEERKVTKHADLEQIDNGVKIPPTGYKCARCDLTDNLWLNLTDGTILCGRKFYDGSGGNNHAVDYYAEKKYPLAVKLGTITPDGADVYSYDEDEMVVDPNLSKHLAHFGIDIQTQKKTSISMAEMEINANQQLKFEFDKITEAGQMLEPAFGPGFTGMINLGNSCYLNSVMQVLFSLDEFQTTFKATAIERYNGGSKPQDDLEIQLRKLCDGLLSGRYSQPIHDKEEEEEESLGIRPNMFKQVIAQGHAEFSKGGQQDAMDFWQHVMTQLERLAKSNQNVTDLSKLFQFQIESRTQCNDSNKVKYQAQPEAAISLPIRLEDGENLGDHLSSLQAVAEAKAKGEKQPDTVPLKISLVKVLQGLFGPSQLEDWYSPASEKKTTATLQRGLKTFPKYLVISANKFYLDDHWIPQKRDIALEVPEELDLRPFQSTGLKPGEEELPQDSTPAVELDPAMIQQLMSMGFGENACKRAVYHNPSNVEAAMEWIFGHMEDPDFNEPFQVPGQASSDQAAGGPSEESIMMLSSMGFTPDQAIKALKATDNNVERAADWIFSHMDELDAPDQDEPGQSDQAELQGTGKYRIKGFISHMGSSAQTGHYICHILKDGQWYIYNDRKVAKSKLPPREYAYVYIYESC